MCPSRATGSSTLRTGGRHQRTPSDRPRREFVDAVVEHRQSRRRRSALRESLAECCCRRSKPGCGPGPVCTWWASTADGGGLRHRSPARIAWDQHGLSMRSCTDTLSLVFSGDPGRQVALLRRRRRCLGRMPTRTSGRRARRSALRSTSSRTRASSGSAPGTPSHEPFVSPATGRDLGLLKSSPACELLNQPRRKISDRPHSSVRDGARSPCPPVVTYRLVKGHTPKPSSRALQPGREPAREHGTPSCMKFTLPSACRIVVHGPLASTTSTARRSHINEILMIIERLTACS